MGYYDPFYESLFLIPMIFMGLSSLPKELGGPSKRRHPSIKALRKLGLRTALEAAREMRGETIEDCFEELAKV